MLATLGLGLGLGQMWGGLYEVGSWGPVAICVIVATIALLVGRGMVPSRAGLALVGGLAGLAILSAASVLWAESSAATAFEAHRWALYATLALLPLLLVRGAVEQRALVLAFGAGGGLVGLLLWSEMLLGGGGDRFIAMRLTEPLGYVNGQAAAFLLAAWPALAVAERSQRSWSRGLAAAAAALLLGLAVLTQSRGAAVGFLASLAAVMVLLPGRERRLWLIIVVLAGVTVAAPTLLDVYRSVPDGEARPTDGVLRSAAVALGVAAALAGGVWAAATAVVARSGQAVVQRASQLGRAAALGLLVVAVIAGAIALGDPIERANQLKEQFTSLETPTFVEQGTRLTSGGGNRYDYWRVAVREFRTDPVVGVGAGGYPRDYFRLRATPEDVRQPHSLELQVLAELGLLGMGLLVVFLWALAFAMWRAGRLLAARRADGIAVVAGVGIIATWVAQTSVDWLHLLPSLTGATVAIAAALLAIPTSTRRRPGPGVLAGAVLLLVVAAAGIGRLTLADRARADAEERLVSAPSEAVEQADRSLQLQPDDLLALYVKAAALAQLDRYDAARDTLVEAVGAEPSNFVPRVLLGDLAARRGDSDLARRRYEEARRLNPRDPQIPARLQLLER